MSKRTRKISDKLWLAAIGVADNSGNLDPLAKFLRAGAPPDDIRELVADLLEHRKLSRAVRTSPNDMKLLSAAHCVKFFKKPEETVFQAIKREAREHGVSERRLRDLLGSRSKITERLNRRSS